MPVHSTDNLSRGVAALEELVTALEQAGEQIIAVTDHSNRWVVVTTPKPARRPAAAKETR